MEISIVKKDFRGQEVWRYPGQVLKQTRDYVLIEAHFNRSDLFFNGMWLNQGDRFVELYYFQRWYNIYEIHDRLNDQLKGWYCNISYPAKYDNASTVSYNDLALDMLVFPDGKHLILDEDEFDALSPTPEIRRQAKSAIFELQKLFSPPVSLRLEKWLLTN